QRRRLTRQTRPRSLDMATRTRTASTPATNEISREGLPLEALCLFGGDRAQQRAGVIVVPDQGRQVLAVGLEGDRLLVDVEVHVLEGPAAELAFPEAVLQPAILLASRKQPGGGLVDRLQDPKLGFEF